MRTKLYSIVILVLVFIMGVVSHSIAESSMQKITAFIDFNINMKLNGQSFEPKDDDGTLLNPIIYKNRSYVPIRVIAESLGVGVQWNATTKTISLGKQEPKSLFDEWKGQLYGLILSKDQNILSVGSNKFTYGLLGLDLPAYVNKMEEFNLSKKYSKLTIKMGVEGEGKAIVRVYDAIDNNKKIMLKQFELSDEVGVQEAEINVTNVDKLQIFISPNGYKAIEKIVIADSYLE